MSKRFLKNAHYSIHQLIKRAGQLSFQSRYDYEQGLKLAITQLHEGGYQVSNIYHLKEKHVQVLIERWQQEQLNPATLKNRLSQLRYAANHINKPHIISSSNTVLGLANRSYQDLPQRAIHDLDLSKIENLAIRRSITLQKLFGLRREECLKFIPSFADRGDHILLKASWTKGAIERTVPITHAEQRAFLDELGKIIPPGASLIPADKTYKQQRDLYDAAVKGSGYKNLHGLRHAYAQNRYKELTDIATQGQGWFSPKQGGPTKKEMSARQKIIDEQVRLVISNQLGHSRIGITRTYL